jgi:hypothetical protein
LSLVNVLVKFSGSILQTWNLGSSAPLEGDFVQLKTGKH